MNYCEPSHLAALVLASQQAGRMTEELALALQPIARGVWERFARMQSRCEDFSQDCLLRAMERLHRVKPDENCFSYFSGMFRHLAWDHWREWERDRKCKPITGETDFVPLAVYRTDAKEKPERTSQRRTVEYQGRQWRWRELADHLKIPYYTLYNRIVVQGKSVQEAVKNLD